MALKSAYNVTPNEIKAGDEFCFVVKLMVCYTKKGKPIYRIYRCPFEGNEAPQGERVDGALEKYVMQALFPVVKWAEGKADPT